MYVLPFSKNSALFEYTFFGGDIMKNSEYEKEINFVFLNVDNPKWENYLKQFNVNGIPQVNLLNRKGNLEVTLVGKQEEKTITESLDDLISGKPVQSKILSSSLSEIA